MRQLASLRVVIKWSEVKRYYGRNCPKDSQAADLLEATKQDVKALCKISL